MLNYSFTTVLMAVLTNNLIIVLIAFCFRHKNILLSVGYKLLIAFLLLVMVRFVFPFELPMARNIVLPAILSAPLAYFQHVFATPYDIPVSMWSIFKLIWAIGILYHICIHVRRHISLSRQLARYSTDITRQEPYVTMLEQICGKRRNPFQVLKVSGISTPSIFGIIKPRILIPSEIELNELDLYYSLCHETLHYFHCDLWIKCGISVLSILYWWNPACKLLKNQTDILLEMRVDGSLVRNDPDTARAYLGTLIHIAEESVRLRMTSGTSLPENLLISLVKNNDGPLIQRYEMMFNARRNKARVPVVMVLSGLVMVLYTGSFSITIENSYVIDQQFSDDLVANKSFFAIAKDDGTYGSFYDGFFTENVDSLGDFIPQPQARLKFRFLSSMYVVIENQPLLAVTHRQGLLL